MSKYINSDIEKYLNLFSLKIDFTLKELKEAYHKKVKENHPDGGGSKVRTTEINLAYEYLKDFYNTTKQHKEDAISYIREFIDIPSENPFFKEISNIVLAFEYQIKYDFNYDEIKQTITKFHHKLKQFYINNLISYKITLFDPYYKCVDFKCHVNEFLRQVANLNSLYDQKINELVIKELELYKINDFKDINELKTNILTKIQNKKFKSLENLRKFIRREIQSYLNKKVIESLIYQVKNENSFDLIKSFKEMVHNVSNNNETITELKSKISNISSKTYYQETFQKLKDNLTIPNLLKKLESFKQLLEDNIITYDTYSIFVKYIRQNISPEDIEFILDFALNIAEDTLIINSDYLYVDINDSSIFFLINQNNNFKLGINYADYLEIKNITLEEFKNLKLIPFKKFIISGTFIGNITADDAIILYEYQNLYLSLKGNEIFLIPKKSIILGSKNIQEKNPLILLEAIIKNINTKYQEFKTDIKL